MSWENNYKMEKRKESKVCKHTLNDLPYRVILDILNKYWLFETRTQKQSSNTILNFFGRFKNDCTGTIFQIIKSVRNDALNIHFDNYLPKELHHLELFGECGVKLSHGRLEYMLKNGCRMFFHFPRYVWGYDNLLNFIDDVSKKYGLCLLQESEIYGENYSDSFKKLQISKVHFKLACRRTLERNRKCRIFDGRKELKFSMDILDRPVTAFGKFKKVIADSFYWDIKTLMKIYMQELIKHDRELTKDLLIHIKRVDNEETWNSKGLIFIEFMFQIIDRLGLDQTERTCLIYSIYRMTKEENDFGVVMKYARLFDIIEVIIYHFYDKTSCKEPMLFMKNRFPKIFLRVLSEHDHIGREKEDKTLRLMIKDLISQC